MYLKGTVDTVTPADMLKNIEINAIAPLELTRQLLPLLKSAASQKRKTVVANISSMAGSIGDNTSGGVWIPYPYRASKAVMNMNSKSQSVDLKSDEIIVLAVHPGWVQTDMGGEKAALTPHASVSGIFDVLAKTNLEQSGAFINYKGDILPW